MKVGEREAAAQEVALVDLYHVQEGVLSRYRYTVQEQAARAAALRHRSRV